MNLSPNFTLDEMTDSQTAVRRGIDNTPTESVMHSLVALCQNVLEPLRAHLGRPIVISSGYRSRALNVAIGGAANSQHTLGEAADIKVPGMPPGEVQRAVRRLGLPVDQCIDEFGAWVHVSHRDINNRGQFLLARKDQRGITRYSEA